MYSKISIVFCLIGCYYLLQQTFISEVNAIMNGYDGAADLAKQFPYVAFFKIVYIPAGKTEQETITLNGHGVLIKPQYVLTTAGIIFDVISSTLISFVVKIGIYDPTLNNTNTFTDLNISNIIINPNYNRTTREYNVALIRLPRKVTDVRLPRLVKEGDVIARNECFIAGYGPLIPNGTTPNPLHIVRQPLLCKPREREECIKRKIIADPTIVVPCKSESEKLCAGYFQSPVYMGPCSTSDGDGEDGALLQCNLKGEEGEKDNQVLVGVLRRDYCPIDAAMNLLPSQRIPALYSSVIVFDDYIEENTLSECDLFFA